MKKTILIVIAVLAVGFLLVDFLITRYLDETLSDFDVGEVMVEACADNARCADAVRTHYPACQQDTADMDAEQYFGAVAEISDCISNASGMDIEALMPDE